MPRLQHDFDGNLLRAPVWRRAHEQQVVGTKEARAGLPVEAAGRSVKRGTDGQRAFLAAD